MSAVAPHAAEDIVRHDNNNDDNDNNDGDDEILADEHMGEAQQLLGVRPQTQRRWLRCDREALFYILTYFVLSAAIIATVVSASVIDHLHEDRGSSNSTSNSTSSSGGGGSSSTVQDMTGAFIGISAAVFVILAVYVTMAISSQDEQRVVASNMHMVYGAYNGVLALFVLGWNVFNVLAAIKRGEAKEAVEEVFDMVNAVLVYFIVFGDIFHWRVRYENITNAVVRWSLSWFFLLEAIFVLLEPLEWHEFSVARKLVEDSLLTETLMYGIARPFVITYYLNMAIQLAGTESAVLNRRNPPLAPAENDVEAAELEQVGQGDQNKKHGSTWWPIHGLSFQLACVVMTVMATMNMLTTKGDEGIVSPHVYNSVSMTLTIVAVLTLALCMLSYVSGILTGLTGPDVLWREFKRTLGVGAQLVYASIFRWGFWSKQVFELIAFLVAAVCTMLANLVFVVRPELLLKDELVDGSLKTLITLNHAFSAVNVLLQICFLPIRGNNATFAMVSRCLVAFNVAWLLVDIPVEQLLADALDKAVLNPADEPYLLLRMVIVVLPLAIRFRLSSAFLYTFVKKTDEP